MSKLEPGKLPPGYQQVWNASGNVHAIKYECSYCGREVASEKGWQGTSEYDAKPVSWLVICPFCRNPTYFDPQARQFPSRTYGRPVSGIADKSVGALYDEARAAVGAGAFTAAVLACRKLLMHIAVSKGASAGDSFVSYVEYLAAKSYVPPDAKDWVDHIRKRSNEANHEIVLMSREDAEEIVQFCEMLLKVIFEFPARAKRLTPGSATAP